MKRIAVAVSGGGRSLRNLLSCQGQQGEYEIAAVISSSPNAAANQIARENDLSLFVADFRGLSPLELEAWLLKQSIDWVVLAGFLKPFPALSKFENRIINIHPALLPKFGGKGMYGMHVHKAVLAAGDAFSGATVHFVNERYDEGRIIAQICISTTGIQTPESLADKVFEAECKLYPQVLAKLCTGNLPLPEENIWIFDPKEQA